MKEREREREEWERERERGERERERERPTGSFFSPANNCLFPSINCFNDALFDQRWIISAWIKVGDWKFNFLRIIIRKKYSFKTKEWQLANSKHLNISWGGRSSGRASSLDTQRSLVGYRHVHQKYQTSNLTLLHVFTAHCFKNKHRKPNVE